MTTRNHELTEAEWDIIEVVWEHEPCAAPTVQEELAARKKWTYSTVKTLMDRMVTKGLLTTERIRNLILYRSAISQKDAQRGELMRAVRRAFGGAFTPMMQFMLDNNALSGHELEDLEGMIRKKRRRERPDEKRKSM
jgi:BlaI family penicillinase repressor